MQSTYFLSSQRAQWSVFVRDKDVLRIKAELPDEAAALKAAIQHAHATGRHFDMVIYRIESDGDLTTVFETRNIA